MSRKEREDIVRIFEAGVARVDPASMVRNVLKLAGESLTAETERERYTYDLTRYDRILVVGAGKASAKMALSIEDILGDRIDRGILAVKAGHEEKLSKIEIIRAGHPVPDEGSIEAGRRILDLCSEADDHTLVINLISGGGSALLTLPYSSGEYAVTLQEMQKVTELLLACGAEIGEINTIRKHLSGVKGGRLAGAIAPAHNLTLILSDVVGDRLDSIASGPTVPDSTTYADAMEIIRRYDIGDSIPESVTTLLEAGETGAIPDTPKEGDPLFASIRSLLIGTNIFAQYAAAEQARGLGYEPVILTSQLTGEAREIAKLFSGMARDLRLGRLGFTLPACILAGGETTVTIRGGGRGGRNQEMALSFVCEFWNRPEETRGVTFLSGGTDGNDGPTDAAGAVVGEGSIETARDERINPWEFLGNNDSYTYFDRTGELLLTGATNTNVCDMQILIVEQM